MGERVYQKKEATSEEQLTARNRSRSYRPKESGYPRLSILVEAKDLTMSPKMDETVYLSNLMTEKKRLRHSFYLCGFAPRFESLPNNKTAVKAELKQITCQSKSERRVMS